MLVCCVLKHVVSVPCSSARPNQDWTIGMLHSSSSVYHAMMLPWNAIEYGTEVVRQMIPSPVLFFLFVFWSGGVEKYLTCMVLLLLRMRAVSYKYGVAWIPVNYFCKFDCDLNYRKLYGILGICKFTAI